MARLGLEAAGSRSRARGERGFRALPFEDDRREDDCGGAQWAEAADSGFECCASLQEGGGRQGACRLVVSRANRSSRQCARAGGTPEPSEQKDFCSAADVPAKGKTSYNGSIMRRFPGAGRA